MYMIIYWNKFNDAIFPLLNLTGTFDTGSIRLFATLEEADKAVKSVIKLSCLKNEDIRVISIEGVHE